MPDSQTTELRALARAMFKAGVSAADPHKALARQFLSHPIRPLPAGGCFFIVALGKAAIAMAKTTLAHLPEGARFDALAVTNAENETSLAHCRVMRGGHPDPDNDSLKAADAIIEMMSRAGPGDHVIALLSGGGSALVCAPARGLGLADKLAINRLLLAEGFDIGETNLVRQHLSRLKGGRMAALAAPARLTSLILSDVASGDPRVVASGPTTGLVGTRRQAAELLARRGYFHALPAPVQTLLSRPETASEPGAGTSAPVVIGSNRLSVDAAARVAREAGLFVKTASLTGDVASAASTVLAGARALAEHQGAALVFGGETTVKLTGTGKGGRNQELALRVAMAGGDLPEPWVFLSAGTDGRDGPTNAAGGLVDSSTIARMMAAGLDPAPRLANNDSHAALKAAGDLLITGATGTNVADLQVFLRGP